MIQAGKRAPHLVAILVGSDPASKAYVASKVKTCATIGYTSTLLEYDASTAEDTILAKIQLLNQDDGVDGNTCTIAIAEANKRK
jgi:methylenetetrahydrofolate dehydrogenase (NADP+)/methenyltetrahydrofolate cyclohydrolase